MAATFTLSGSGLSTLRVRVWGSGEELGDVIVALQVGEKKEPHTGLVSVSVKTLYATGCASCHDCQARGHSAASALRRNRQQPTT